MFPNDGIAREEMHHRRIDMRGYRRSDGLFEIVGRVTDRKPHDYDPGVVGETVPAHEPIHDMGVRIVYDEHLLIHDIATFMDSTPYPACLGGGAILQAMKGVRMASGWTREVKSRLAGARSCTHLMELLIPMATGAIQSISTIRNAWPDKLDADGRPTKIGTCYAYAADSPVVAQRWPNLPPATVRQQTSG